jgi:CubicO group peptidase (beta-lactamase class C family)
MSALRRTVPIAFLLLLAFAASPASPSAAAQPSPLTGLDAYIESAMRDWQVPGLAIAVVSGDAVLFARGYGTRTIGRADEPVDEHTLFAIASTTKALTAAALGTLVDEGRLRWDDPVTQHLPAFQLHDPYITREITVRDLLTHRSGIARSDQLWIAAPFDRDELLRRARHLPRVASFRAEYGYHNVMYLAAGELAAAVSGRTWDDLVELRIFRPLGMTRSTTRAALVETRDNVATSHIRVDGRPVAVPRRNYDNLGGAGAAFSTVHDLARWVRMHLHGGTFEGTRLLSAATLAELHTPQTIIRIDSVAARMFPSSHLRAYALGWNVQDYHGRKLVHHSGNVNWTRTQIGMLPGEGVGVVVIANLNTSSLQHALMYRVLDAFLGLPPRDWSAEYLVLARRADERAAERRREIEAARIADTLPSHVLEQYTGTYASELFGELRIALEDGRFVLRYAPDYIADLEHWHHDTFRGNWRRAGSGSAFVTFSLDARARVTSVDVEDLGEFRRVAGSETRTAREAMR